LALPSRVAGLAALVVCLGSCAGDGADREYLAALHGDEDGSTYEERIAHLDRAIALEPERARYHEARGVLRIDGIEFAAAMDDLDRAIELADRPYLRFLRGLVQCQLGLCASAIPDFDRAITEQPENGQFYRGRALALVAVGRPAQGLADAERLVALEPQVGHSYYARANALAAMGNHEAAVRDFDAALERMPELIYPLLSRARSYEALGDSARARSDREAAAMRMVGGSCGYCLDPFRY
jgi:tetratricopeptide (TPR) repeat protein